MSGIALMSFKVFIFNIQSHGLMGTQKHSYNHPNFSIISYLTLPINVTVIQKDLH